MTKNNKIILGVVIFVILLIIIAVLIRKGSGVSNLIGLGTQKQVKIEKPAGEQIIGSSDSDVEIKEFSTKDLKEKQQQIELPKEISLCKNDDDIFNCIVTVDPNTGNKDLSKFSDRNIMAQRLDLIDEYKDGLTQLKSSKDLKDVVVAMADKISSIYLRLPSRLLFEKNDCKTDFCKQIFDQTKVILLKRVFANRLITTSSTCSRIPEDLPKNYCLGLFSDK